MIHWADPIFGSGQEYFYSTLEGMLVHRKVLPSTALNLLVPIYTTEWREALSEFQKCLAQEHKTMSPARAWFQTAPSGVERTNH